MDIRRFAWGVGLLALIGLAGCEDDPGSNLVTGPEEAQPTELGKGYNPGGGQDGWSAHGSDVVFTLSNATSGNSVLVFTSSAGGSLSPDGSFATGGSGTGAGLGNQGALVKQGKLLYAVNAGSNDVSVLRIHGKSLDLVSTVPSGGLTPISLTVKGDLLYVLNGGGSGNIAGFRGARSGRLRPIAGSSLPLSGANVAPAQIQFSPTRRILVVTEKATNRILTYIVGFDGRAHGPIVQNSVGETPFGFDFTPRGYLVVSDAFGANPFQSALSSYAISRRGVIDLVTGPVADNQTAACWVVVSPDGRFAYTTNAGTNNISGYRVSHDGKLTLFGDGGNTATSDATPIDMTLSNNSRMLYCLNAGGNSITSYRRNPASGTLTPVGRVGDLPSGANGLAAD